MLVMRMELGIEGWLAGRPFWQIFWHVKPLGNEEKYEEQV